MTQVVAVSYVVLLVVRQLTARDKDKFFASDQTKSDNNSPRLLSLLYVEKRIAFSEYTTKNSQIYISIGKLQNGSMMCMEYDGATNHAAAKLSRHYALLWEAKAVKAEEKKKEKEMKQFTRMNGRFMSWFS